MRKAMMRQVYYEELVERIGRAMHEDVKLREVIHRCTNEEQEKRIKDTGLLANCIMLDNTVEISTALNALATEGLIPTIDELAALSPYQTRHIKRFGNYELDLQAIAAPLTDDLTFEIAPPAQADVVEAGRDGPLPPEIKPSVG